MWILNMASEPPKIPEPIQIVIEQRQEVAPEQETPPPIQTWKDNPNNCNEDTQYIAAEAPFYCIDKPQTVNRTTNNQNTARTAANSSNGWYPVGQCTWYVSTRRPVGQWNNATDWKWQAQRDGYTYSSTPVAGAIGWKPGHVVYVESVNSDNTVTISEANYDYNGSIRTITIPANEYTYLY